MSVETMVKDYRLVREGRRIAVYNKWGDLVSLAMNWREAEEFVNDLPTPVNSVGSYFAKDGTLMNADGTRSIFDDVDK